MSKANGTLVGAKNDFTSLKGRTLATVVAPLQGRMFYYHLPRVPLRCTPGLMFVAVGDRT